MLARAFMRGNDAEIEPRKKWPSGVSQKGNIVALNAGRAVAFADDPGWSFELGELSRSRPGEIPQSMLDGAVATLKRWSKVCDTRPTSVVALPAADMRSNVQLAEHIAQIGKLPLVDVFSWTGSAPPDDAASTPVVAHLEKAIQMKPDFELPRGPVLLVSTEVRTRWTATVAGALLREAGAYGVLLLALHQRP